MLDKVDAKAAITVTSGALVLTAKIYCNDAMAAAFAAVTAGEAYPVVTYGTGYINVVLTVTPDAPVGLTAEPMRYLQVNGKESGGTLNV